MTRVIPLFFILAFLSLGSCTNSNRDKEMYNISSLEGVDLDDIYFDYRITAEEGDDKLNILLQYRDGGEEGPTLVVDSEGKVELDGVLLMADSSGMSGAFYETQLPIATFTGNHSIVLTLADKTFKEDFHFEPMFLMEELPAELLREDLVIEIGGLQAAEYVRVLMFDTSSTNEEINRLDTVRNGRIFISKTDLENFSSGEIQLELHRERDKAVKNGTDEGGRIQMTYVLKRKFHLKD